MEDKEIRVANGQHGKIRCNDTGWAVEMFVEQDTLHVYVWRNGKKVHVKQSELLPVEFPVGCYDHDDEWHGVFEALERGTEKCQQK